MEDTKKRVPEKVAEQLAYYYQHGLQSLFDAGIAVQDEVLTDLIELGRESLYAKEHGFGDIQTKEEFCAKVPVSDYEDYRAYVAQNMKADAKQLSELETEYYLLSTGYSNQGKYYAETRLGALARQLSIDIWNMMLTKAVPIMTDPNVKMLAVTNCAPLEEAENGKAVRRTSGQAAKGLWESHPQFYVYPYEFLEAEMSDDDRDYLTAVYTLKEKHFNMLFCNNLAYFGVILDWIEKCPQQMIQDIRTGFMTANISDKDREILSATFQADPERAEELQQILDKNGHLAVADIWPDFVFVGTWLSGSVGRLAKDVMRRLPEQVQYISESYGSSEAMYNIPMKFNCPYGPAAVYSCYFEFLKIDGSGQIVDMAHVEDGAYYELLITTYSGLYRYNLHDIVRIQGFTGETANIEFCCRSTEVFSVNQNRIYGYELMQLIEQAEKELGCFLSFFQGLEEQDSLSVVVQPADEQFDGEGFSACLGEIMKNRGLQPGNLYVMSRDYCLSLFHGLMTNGRNIQSIKLPLVADKKNLQELTVGIYTM